MANYPRNKIRRLHKGRIKNVETKGIMVNKGSYGLKALESGRLSKDHLELLRRYIKRKLRFVRKRQKRKIRVKIWLLVQCKYPITKKPAEIRMGKGKGAVETYVYRIRAGKILLETIGLSSTYYSKIFGKIALKLPVSTRLVKRLINA